MRPLKTTRNASKNRASLISRKLWLASTSLVCTTTSPHCTTFHYLSWKAPLVLSNVLLSCWRKSRLHTGSCNFESWAKLYLMGSVLALSSSTSSIQKFSNRDLFRMHAWESGGLAFFNNNKIQSLEPRYSTVAAALPLTFIPSFSVCRKMCYHWAERRRRSSCWEIETKLYGHNSRLMHFLLRVGLLDGA